MPQAYKGDSVTGSGITFTTPGEGLFRLELVTFTLTTDGTAGNRGPAVIYTDPGAALPTARMWDWNEAPASATIYYTFGIGLRPFNCVITSGMMVEHDLPDTELWPLTTITLRSMFTTGSTATNDTLTNVFLYGQLISDSTTGTVAIPPLDPAFLPGEEAA